MVKLLQQHAQATNEPEQEVSVVNKRADEIDGAASTRRDRSMKVHPKRSAGCTYCTIRERLAENTRLTLHVMLSEKKDEPTGRIMAHRRQRPRYRYNRGLCRRLLSSSQITMAALTFEILTHRTHHHYHPPRGRIINPSNCSGTFSQGSCVVGGACSVLRSLRRFFFQANS